MRSYRQQSEFVLKYDEEEQVLEINNKPFCKVQKGSATAKFFKYFFESGGLPISIDQVRTALQFQGTFKKYFRNNIMKSLFPEKADILINYFYFPFFQVEGLGTKNCTIRFNRTVSFNTLYIRMKRYFITRGHSPDEEEHQIFMRILDYIVKNIQTIKANKKTEIMVYISEERKKPIEFTFRC